MSKWIREDGFVMTYEYFIRDANGNCYTSGQQLSWDEALEEFEKMWQENYEQEALLGEQLEEENESGESSTTKSGTDEEARQPRNNSERVAKGKPCEFSECTCGHKGVSIPLSSHSDWCDYKLWRESLNKRAEEYSSGRIFF